MVDWPDDARRPRTRRPSSPVSAGSEYDRAAAAAAAAVIARYSTSFGLAVRLLGSPVRPRVRAVYALVRVADEIVDGAAADHGLDRQGIADALDAYERETEAAMAAGFSTDLVVHAFAQAARATGIETDLTRPFFASMRMDLGVQSHDEDSFARYVHGSAEVVGLMCLQIFATDRSDNPVEPGPDLADGARRLGAAFQKVNFLRDLGADLDGRNRSYFPGIDPSCLDDAQRDLLLDDIEADLAAAEAVIDELPRSSRTAVRIAHDLFAELAHRLRRTPAATLRTSRVRVDDRRKAVVAACVIARDLRPGARR